MRAAGFRKSYPWVGAKQRMTTVILDIETFYQKPNYSLSSRGKHKLTTEEYLRDDRFRVHGVGVKVGDGNAVWFSRGKFLQHIDRLRDICRKSLVVAHNAKFDFAALAWHHGFEFGLMADTLSMARPVVGVDAPASLAALSDRFGLGSKGRELADFDGLLNLTPEEDIALGAYCVNDVELTAKLFTRLSDGFPKDEMLVIDRTLRMFVEPILEGNQILLAQHHEETVGRKRKMFDELRVDSESLGSNATFAQMLLDRGVDPPTKWSVKQKKQVYAFAKSDEEFVALKEHPDDTVQLLIEARLGVKSTIDETRAKRLLGISQRGALPVPKKYCGASTWRWSGEDSINLENLPRNGKLRKALTAPEGMVIVSVDSANIEARQLAWIAGQADLNQAFAANADVYSLMATKIYGRTIDRKNNEDDFVPGHVGKAVILGAGFGLGWKKFQQMIRAGMLGAKGVLFDKKFVDVLNVDVTAFLEDKRNKTGVTQTFRPWDDMRTHEIHCAVAKRIIDDYRQSVPAIVAFWKQMGFAIECMAEGRELPFGVCDVLHTTYQGMRTPGGLKLLYPDLRLTEVTDVDPETGEEVIKKQWTYAGRGGVRKRTYGGHLTENVVQHLARLVVSEQMVEVSRRYKVASTTHDEIIFVAPEREAEEALQFGINCMRVAPKWARGLVLNAEGSFGPCYS